MWSLIVPLLMTYTLTRVHQYKVHLHERFYFSVPVQVCLLSFESESVAAFVSVLRIYDIGVDADLKYDLRTANGKGSIRFVFLQMSNYSCTFIYLKNIVYQLGVTDGICMLKMNKVIL